MHFYIDNSTDHAPRIIYMDLKYMDHTVIDVQRSFIKKLKFMLALLVKIIEHYYWNLKMDFCFLLHLFAELQ